MGPQKHNSHPGLSFGALGFSALPSQVGSWCLEAATLQSERSAPYPYRPTQHTLSVQLLAL